MFNFYVWLTLRIAQISFRAHVFKGIGRGGELYFTKDILFSGTKSAGTVGFFRQSKVVLVGLVLATVKWSQHRGHTGFEEYAASEPNPSHLWAFCTVLSF